MFRSYKDTVRTPVKVSRSTSKKYYCDLCEDDNSKIWASESDVDIHRRKAHKEILIDLMREPKNFMCSVCLRPQPDKASLISHIKTKHLLSSEDATFVKREIFICDYCCHLFFNKLLLIAHIKYFHLLTNLEKKTHRTICPACNKSVAIKSIWFHFVYHGALHSGTCPICLSTFEDHSDVLNHIETHWGYYSCSVCLYETKKENLYINHIEQHKKTVNLEGRNDVNKVLKYYVPQKRVGSWNKKVINIFKGITMAPEIQICVLCRTMCVTEEQMLQHIYGDHSPGSVSEIKRYTCACGEEFFNRVLLKHHIFTLKGQHTEHDVSETPIKSVQKMKSAIIQEDKREASETNTEVDDDVDRSFGIVIEIRKSADDNDDPIDFGSLSDAQEESQHKVCSDDQSQSQNEMEIQSQDDIESQSQIQMEQQSQNIIIQSLNGMNSKSHIKIMSQSDNTMDFEDSQSQTNMEIVSQSQNENEMDIQSQNLTNMQQHSLDTSLTDNDIYKDQIILSANAPNNNDISLKDATELIQKHRPIIATYSSRRKNSNQKNIKLLNQTSPRRFESLNKRVLSIDGNIELSSDGTANSLHCIDYTTAPETAVYEVLEVPTDSNEESGKIIVEDALLFR